MKKLQDEILVTGIISKTLIEKWNSIINTLSKYNVIDTIEITPVQAEVYKFDMEGLFKELNIPIEFIYAHIRVNGYLTSNDYDGYKLKIDLLDTNVLKTYYDMFNAN